MNLKVNTILIMKVRANCILFDYYSMQIQQNVILLFKNKSYFQLNNLAMFESTMYNTDRLFNFSEFKRKPTTKYLKYYYLL